MWCIQRRGCSRNTRVALRVCCARCEKIWKVISNFSKLKIWNNEKWFQNLHPLAVRFIVPIWLKWVHVSSPALIEFKNALSWKIEYIRQKQSFHTYATGKLPMTRFQQFRYKPFSYFYINIKIICIAFWCRILVFALELQNLDLTFKKLWKII